MQLSWLSGSWSNCLGGEGGGESCVGEIRERWWVHLLNVTLESLSMVSALSLNGAASRLGLSLIIMVMSDR